MRDAVYLTMCGGAPSIEAALEMDQVQRSAAIMIAQEIEEARSMQTMRAFALALGAQ